MLMLLYLQKQCWFHRIFFSIKFRQRLAYVSYRAYSSHQTTPLLPPQPPKKKTNTLKKQNKKTHPTPASHITSKKTKQNKTKHACTHKTPKKFKRKEKQKVTSKERRTPWEGEEISQRALARRNLLANHHLVYILHAHNFLDEFMKVGDFQLACLFKN